jgi:hypothetical protein
MRLTDTEKEILAAIAHLPNNYSLGQFIRRKYQPLMNKLKKDNPNWEPKDGMDIQKKFRGPSK